MITGYFGLPGCGKSTMLAKLARKYIRRGYRVYVLADYPVDGCYLFNWSDLGNYDMSRSVILIDEISLRADNRDFKRFSDQVKQFFILHRHYHCDIVWFTQQYDGVDRKIRELTTCLYYIRSIGQLSYAVRVNRFIYINKDEKEIKTGYKLPGILSFITGWFNGSRQLCYRPLYFKMFDSYAAPKLKQKQFRLYKVMGKKSPDNTQGEESKE